VTRPLQLIVQFVIVTWLVHAVPAVSELRVLSAVGMRQVMVELESKFERATGHSLSITYESSGIIARRVESGEAADVVLINQAGIDRLTRAARIEKRGATILATANVGVAVRAGAAKPDVSTPEAFRRTMLAARMVAYPDPVLDGSSGVHIARVFERLTIAAVMKPKTVYAAPPGPGASTPGSLVAGGHADIALHQMQELRAVKGIDIVGPLPNDLQETFVFSIAVLSTARDATAAKALVAFLLTPESKAVMASKGMGAVDR
jgi:molybdate transport system substrate-binding protein